MESLKKTAVSGLMWTLADKFIRQGLTFFVSIILARLMLPADYGLLGMVAIFMAVGYALIDSGMASSLIRTEKPDDLDYSTVFTTNIILSIVIYLLIFITAPLIADFYKQPILTSLLRVLSLNIIISAFGSIQNTIFTKQMAFKKLLRINIPGTFIASLIGIVLAYYDYGAWSMVYMWMAGTLWNTLFIWLVSKWQPSFRFSIERFKIHFLFGINLSMSSIINTIFDNIYNIIIGKLYSPVHLGFFTRAQSLKQLPVDNLSSALYKVTYPLFSSIQNDDRRLGIAYNKMMLQVTFWLAPLLICMAFLAEPLIRFLFTEKWLPAVPYFQIISISGLFNALSSYNLNILKVKGKTQLFFRLEMVKKVIIVLGITVVTVFTQSGILGLLYFQTVYSAIAYLINAYYAGKNISLTIKDQISVIAKPLIMAIFSGILCYVIDFTIHQQPDAIRLLISGVSGAVFYLSTSYFTKQAAALDFIEILKIKRNVRPITK